MGECDYLNARVRAMGAELFSRELFEQMLGTDSGTLPMDALLASPYGGVLRESLAEQAGIAAIEHALRRDLVRCFSRVRSMATQGARALLDTQFARWDLQNVLAVLRGVSARAQPREITAALLPAGASPRRSLRIWQPALTPSPLLESLPHGTTPLRSSCMTPSLPVAGRPRGGLFAAYFRGRSPLKASRHGGPTGSSRSLVTRQIDLANVKSALEVARSRESKEARARAAVTQSVDGSPGDC